MDGIGIIGAGVAGLHLGLLLRRNDIPTTLYSDRTPEQLGSGRLPAAVAHHNTTVTRERALGVEHWSAQDYGYAVHHHYVGGPLQARFTGGLGAPSRAVDYRLYLPRLLQDFTAAGGELRIRSIGPGELDELAARHDLVVAATGRGGLGGLFEPIAEKSPYTSPQRKLCAGLYTGVAPAEPKGVTLSIAPGDGELIEIPMYSFAGHVTALFFEAVPGGAFEALAQADHDADPRGFRTQVLHLLREHHPSVYERVDPATFGLTDPLDLVQGAITPRISADHITLESGRPIVAVGDVHALVDPVVGQGANCASYSAWQLGRTILDDPHFDEHFCDKVAQRRRRRVQATTDWTNLMLAVPPPPHLLELITAMSRDPAVADVFTSNFNYPERQWDILATPQRTRAFLARTS
ncbi:styrene monooxygenase/indole monooxygenase family protein [Saccharopolyspora griseoalba]|uniref:Styrene monooxygenase/indole monooxygenase family protein n=1 Tax=Saccharopolyspora griseoalba TaxID=1431848 RepID=A0ABW2LCU2_9PSEU